MPNPHSYPSVGPPARTADPHQQLRPSRRAVLGGLGAFAVLPVLAACGSRPVEATAATSPTAAPTTGGTPASELRLGHFPNVTHGAALVGISQGFFAEALGSTTLTTQAFNAGPAAIEALTAKAIDAAYLGPNPAINAFSKSGGTAVRIIAGAASGGAQLVVRPEITSAAQLKGKELATPELGGTQDVALRTWLTSQGLANSTTGGGDVTITPTDNASTLQLFQQGRLDGAWLPEPWASRLVLDAGASVLVDEKSLWPDGKFVTTHLIVATDFLAAHPQTVKALLAGHVKAVEWVSSDPGAPAAVNAKIAELTTKPLSDAVITRAFGNISFTDDPLASTLPTLLEHGVGAGTTKDVDLKGIYDLRLLNEVLTAAGSPAVSAAGLGEE